MLLPVGPPRNPSAGGANNAEFHNAGEVWCAALWEVFVNLVAKHGHAEAERRMLRYVIGGLKLTPIAADLHCRPATGSSRRCPRCTRRTSPRPGRASPSAGMGAGAVAPPSSSTELTGVVESFETPAIPPPLVA